MEQKRNWRVLLPYLILPLIFILAISMYSSSQVKSKTEYYEIVQLFDQGKVSNYSLNLSSGALEYQLKDSKEIKEYTVPNVSVFLEDVNDSVREYNKNNPDAPIKYDLERGTSNSWWVNLLPTLVVVVLLGFMLYFTTRRMNQAMNSEANRTFGFGKAKVKQVKDENNKTTFTDVAGAQEEKEEMQEIVDFLKDPQKFNELGARIPKGVLLVGPPGTGKTLLARAVAGEANVPFFFISGSDFVEMYVGVGASRVRDLFDKAKKNSPSIIFIDEIDAVGRHRGAGMGGGHDEREQTLNQLLVEMDGFGKNEGVIILAATNRPDILDPALLRPGRFDRQITVGYPDVTGREQILKVHSNGKPLGPDVDLKVIAHSTAGFVGADLENLLNEAALLAARKNQKAITMADIEEATIKVVVGTQKRSHKMSDKEKRMTAYHEAGHAVATYCLESQAPVRQISIIPRGMAGGYTMSVPTEDKNYMSKKDMLDNLVTLLGGRMAEELIFEDITTGASNDIERATDIARKMITRYGMSSLGPIAYGSGNDEVFLGRDYNHTRNYSESVASEIDKEIASIITRANDRCRKIITEHMEQFKTVAEYLFIHETIDGDEFKQLMEKGFVVPSEASGLPVETQEQTGNSAETDVLGETESKE